MTNHHSRQRSSRTYFHPDSAPPHYTPNPSQRRARANATTPPYMPFPTLSTRENVILAMIAIAITAMLAFVAIHDYHRTIREHSPIIPTTPTPLHATTP